MSSSCLRAKQHAGTRLSAIASGFGMVRTEINGVQSRIMTGKFGPKNIVDFVNQRFREVSALDTGLVGDQHGFHSAVIDFSYRGSGPWKRFDTGRC